MASIFRDSLLYDVGRRGKQVAKDIWGAPTVGEGLGRVARIVGQGYREMGDPSVITKTIPAVAGGIKKGLYPPTSGIPPVGAPILSTPTPETTEPMSPARPPSTELGESGVFRTLTDDGVRYDAGAKGYAEGRGAGGGSFTVARGPGQGNMSNAQWDALPNSEKIARNVASYEAQTQSIRDLRNAQRAAEGSRPVGVGGGPSVGIGGGGGGGAGFDRIPTAPASLDYNDFKSISNPNDRRKMMGIAAGLVEQEASNAADIERARIAQGPAYQRALAEQGNTAFEQQMDRIAAMQREEELGMDAEDLARKQQAAQFSQGLESAKYQDTQIAQIAETDPTAAMMARRFSGQGRSPETVAARFNDMLSDPGLDPKVAEDLTKSMTSLQEGDDATRAAALRRIQETFAKYLEQIEARPQ